jgi:hypothetical protein
MNEELERLINRADKSFEKGYFKEAQELYEEAFEKIIEEIENSKFIRRIAKAVGWGAALLTGGIGLEDIFIIPGVSKGIEYLFGINPSELADALKYVSYQELCSIINAPELLDKKDEYYYLKKFALLYQDKDIKNPLKVVFDLYFPTDFGLERNSADFTLMIRSRARNIKSIEVELNNNIYELNLNDLIYEYASHFKWEFVLDVVKEKSSKRNKNVDKEEEIDEETAREILGVSKNASKEEIKKAYYQKVSQWHPDKLGNMAEELKKYAEEQLRKINIAYKILTENNF